MVREFSSPALVNHCLRSYLWAAAYGAEHRLIFDAELLYVSAMLHDIGLDRRTLQTFCENGCTHNPAPPSRPAAPWTPGVLGAAFR